MKKLTFIIILFLCIGVNTLAKEDQTVTLTVGGQGGSIEEARQNALRSAIEQAYGVFVSSRTEVLNDALIRDEIVSVASGNIQNYEIINETEITKGYYSSTLKATVSISNLISFAESKGMEVEFRGSLFAFNINQQILNEQNELNAIKNMALVIKQIADISFDYKLDAGNPISLDDRNEKWKIPIKIAISPNKNFFSIPEYIYNTLQSLTMTREEALNYIELEKEVFPISFAASEEKYDYFILRNRDSAVSFLKMLFYFNRSLTNFEICNGVTSFDADYMNDQRNRISFGERNFRINDDKFRLIMGISSLSTGRCNVFHYGFFPIGHGNFEYLINYEKAYKIWTRGYVGDRHLRLWQVEHLYSFFNFNNNCFKTELTPSNYGMPKAKQEQFNFLLSFVDQGTVFRPKTPLILRLKYEIAAITDNPMHSTTRTYTRNTFGITVSFIGLKENEDIVFMSFDDVRTLSEIQQIEGYRIISLGNQHE